MIKEVLLICAFISGTDGVPQRKVQIINDHMMQVAHLPPFKYHMTDKGTLKGKAKYGFKFELDPITGLLIEKNLFSHNEYTCKAPKPLW